MLSEALPSLQKYITSIEVDPLIVQVYQAGLVIGILIATTLTFFPGKPWGIKYGKNAGLDDEVISSNDDSTNNNREKTEDGDSSRQAPPLSQSSGWIGDEIPKEKLEKLRKKLDLTEEQMQKAIGNARHEATTGQRQRLDGTLGGKTLHQKINTMVYIVMIIAVVYILNWKYKNFATRFLVGMFPKEAALMGLS